MEIDAADNGNEDKDDAAGSQYPSIMTCTTVRKYTTARNE